MSNLAFLPPDHLPANQNELPSQDPLLAEAASLQIGSASLAGYGSLPNPQAVYEAVNTGSSASIAAAAQQGSPLFEAELAGTPAGQAMGGLPYSNVPTQAPATPATPIWTYNAKTDAQTQQNLLKQSENASFQSLGMVPESNMGWLQAQRTANPATVKKWQNLLQKDGFYQKQDGVGNHVNGVWDPNTEAAMQGFLIARFLPAALYAKDPAQQTNAGMFLNALNFDWTSMQNNLRDPTVQAQVAQQWAAAQGLDQGSTPVSNLQAYANLYGAAALPTSYQDILHPSFIDNIRSTLVGVPVVGLLNDIPGVAGVWHGAVNLLTGQWDPNKITQDPRTAEAATVTADAAKLDHLTDSEQKNMQPLLDQVKQNSGWFGFMSEWDHDRNAVLLSLGLVAKEFISSGKWENPFDLSSSSNAWVQAHADNMTAAIFGDQFAQDNPALAGVLNFAINTADDPLSYFNIIGDTEKVQEFLGMRTISNIIKDPETRSALKNVVGSTVRERVNDQFFKATRAAYAQKKMNFADALDVFGGVHSGEAARNQADLIKKVISEPDEHKARDLFLNGDGNNLGFGYLVNTGRTVYNTRAAWKGLAQVKNTNKLNKLRVMMGLGEQAPMELLNSPELAVRTFRNYMNLSEMPMAQQVELIDKFYNIARNDTEGFQTLEVAQEVRAAIMKAYHDNGKVTPQQLEAHHGNVVSSRAGVTYERPSGDETKGATKMGGRNVDDTTSFAPNPRGRSAKEMHDEISMVPKANDPADRAEQIIQLREFRQEKDMLVERGADPALIRHVDEEIAAITRPGPMLTTQLANQFKMPYTPYEMITAKFRPLRALESVQGNLKVDAYMGVWRRWTLARLSTALRLTLGDDTIRPAAVLLNLGHPITATRYLGAQIGRSIGLAVPGMPDWLLKKGGLKPEEIGKSEAQLIEEASTGTKVKPTPNALGKVLQAVPKGPRQRVLEHTLMMIGNDPAKMQVLQNFSKLTGELNIHSFHPFMPGQGGYVKALQNMIDNHWRQDPLVQEWLKGYRKETAQASRDHLANYIKNINEQDPNYGKVKQWLYAQGGGTGSEYDDNFIIDRFDMYARQVFDHPAIRRMARYGSDIEALRKLNKSLAWTGDRSLPTISARPDSSTANNAFLEMLNKYPNSVFERLTKPMVDSARANGMEAVKNMYANQIRAYFKNSPRSSAPGWEAMVDQESTARAVDWVINNTYQGGRSVLGGTVRNVMPFYGAAVNMDRFFVRQALAKPWMGGAALRAAAASQSSTSSSTPNPSTGLMGFLAHTGFGGGEGITFDPLHAFFLTSDGLGSFVPGTGPIFAPIWTGISHFQPLADAFSGIPGISTQIDFATGEATPQFPWIGNLLQGAYMAATGNEMSIPFLTNTSDRENQLVNDKIQQWDRNKQGSGPDGTVTQEDQQAIIREVGRDQMLAGGLQYAVPMTPGVTDTTAQANTQQMDNWRLQDTDQGKDAVTAQALGVSVKQWQDALNQTPGAPSIEQLVAKNPTSAGVMMAYEDSRLSPEARDALASNDKTAWVVSATSSKYQYTTSQSPTSLQQWNLMRSLGQVQTLQSFGGESTPTFLGKIQKERDINSGWVQYDNLKNWEYNTLVANNWTTQSPLYSAWKASYFDPQVIKLQASNPAWWQQFGASSDTSSAPGLAAVTGPLRAIQTWEVIPQHGDFENAVSVLWRNALAITQQAGNAMYGLKLTGGTQAEQDLILQSVQQQLQALAALNPQFASQLAGTRFSKWEDIVQFEADEMSAQANLGQGATIPTVGPTAEIGNQPIASS